MNKASKAILKMEIALLPIKGFLIATIYHYIQNGRATSVSYVLIAVFLVTSVITIIDVFERLER